MEGGLLADAFEAPGDLPADQFGERLAFCGGVSTQRLLPYGTPDEVRAEVRRLIAEVGEGGGYICAPAHSIPGDAKPENIMAMIEVLNEG